MVVQKSVSLCLDCAGTAQGWWSTAQQPALANPALDLQEGKRGRSCHLVLCTQLSAMGQNSKKHGTAIPYINPQPCASLRYTWVGGPLGSGAFFLG